MNNSNSKRRHYWSADTERYASPDALLAYLENAWEADSTVVVDWFAESAGHYVKVYFFLLRRDGKIVQMPVLASPILPRILAEYDLKEVEPMGLPSSLEQVASMSEGSGARVM